MKTQTKFIFNTLFLCLFLSITNAILAQSDETIKWIEDQMEVYMEAHAIPALAIGIVQNGSIKSILTKGHKTVEQKEPVGPNTLYQIASLSKTFTGILAHQLSLDKKWDLEASIVNFLPGDVSVATKEKLKPIRIIDVLHHQAGLPRDPKSIPRLRPMVGGYSDADLLKDLELLKVEEIPQPVSYSNVGYGMIGYFMRQATGQSYEKLLQTYICEPLKMKHTTSVLQIAKSKELPTPYIPGSKKKATVPWEMGNVIPAGGIFSSIEDLSKMMVKHLAIYQMESEQSQSSFFLTPKTVVFGPTPANKYGYGFFEAPFEGDSTMLMYGHSGDVDGFGSQYDLIPSKDIGLVMLTSKGGGWFFELKRLLWLKLLDLPIYEPIELSKSQLKQFIGKYDFGTTVLTITLKGNQLYTQTPGNRKLKIFPASDEKLFYKAFNAQMEWQKDENGKGYKIVYTQDGRMYYPKKVD